MPHEHPQSPHQPKPGDEFGFSEHEQLFDRTSHQRLLKFIDDAAITVHEVEETYNNYGRFLFVTLSKPGQNRRIWVTFWGLGFHEGRERWLTQEWFWHFANSFPALLQSSVGKDQVKQIIVERYNKVSAYAHQETQSRRGKVFEILADLTDEDGAWAELEDLPWWLLGDDE